MIIRRATQVGEWPIRAASKAVPSARIASVATRRIVRNLIDSMRYHGLVGMAAPQIGIAQRIFVTEIRKTKVRNPQEADAVRVFINPRITRRSSRRLAPGYEGCGSVAHGGLFGNVRRAREVAVSAYDEKGRRFTLRATGLLARIIQHETDHLDGKVFLDRMEGMKTLISREELLRQAPNPK